MTDLFQDKAGDFDSRPIPQQISQGVTGAMLDAIVFTEDQTVMDFGAGTGLVATRIAPKVGRVLAVDVSPAMLGKLAEKPELQGKAEIHCQDILETPLGEQVDVVVSAMAAHHVSDTAALMETLFAHLAPGGQLALADLDSEDGTFHPPGMEGVFHQGFDRESLGVLAASAGFEDVGFVTACSVDRNEQRYPIFLLTARRPAA